MAKFKIKQDLSLRDQAELARIEAISSGLRTSTDTNFLTALAPYRTNRVLRYDTQKVQSTQNTLDHFTTDYILEAEGNTLPTGDSGFKPGAIFYDLTRSGRNAYRNTGTVLAAIWSIVDSTVASNSPSLSPSASTSPSPSGSASSSSSGSASSSGSQHRHQNLLLARHQPQLALLDQHQHLNL
jgi:hypothetical protein